MYQIKFIYFKQIDQQQQQQQQSSTILIEKLHHHNHNVIECNGQKKSYSTLKLNNNNPFIQTNLYHNQKEIEIEYIQIDSPSLLQQQQQQKISFVTKKEEETSFFRLSFTSSSLSFTIFISWNHR
ncbi:hypothetical protein DERP_000681 [Dermatophagoides pteronyssinus]|uniref:Uncharacterized protein n=1 Tax=Dermatophagoides pteronyssinus TaxID=6956 RepID=A0ABQ8J0T6_DERPT|nr:hypothetical protein DERP_000681 [Dermatophagoides pteronyssinus]